jgi:4Fe-4S ferredoxin
MKRYKKEGPDKLDIGEVFYAKRFGLTVDRRLCKGCDVCKLVCPREAITLKPVPKGPDGKALPPTVDIDENKCDFHAICAAACPFSAIRVTINDQEKTPVVEKEVYPALLRDIQIDSERCEPDCRICEEKCPLGIVSVRFEPLTAAQIKERKKAHLPAASAKTVVEVKKELCPTCQICQTECPARVIKVTKFFDGSIKIKQELCPTGCHDCLDVCPVDALHSVEDGKVSVNSMMCIYCGACLNVCPKPGALELKRTSIRHTPVKSGAWNKALEKLTSTIGLDKELGAKRMSKAREAIKNLKSWR